MNRIRMMLMALVAVFAIGAVGATAAQAGTGTVDIQIDAGTGPADCEGTVTHGGWSGTTPTWSATVGSMTPTVCDVDEVSIPAGCTVTVAKTAIPSGETKGDATLNGCFFVKTKILGFITIRCTYSASLTGKWWFKDPPANTTKVFEFLNQTATKVAPSDSACPSPVDVNHLKAELSNP